MNRTVTYYVGDGFVVNSDGDVRSMAPYAGFLADPKDGRVKCFYWLDWDVAKLIRMIGEQWVADDLKSENQAQLGDWLVMKYIPGRFYSQKSPSGAFAVFSDCHQYTDARPEENVGIERAIDLAKMANVTADQVVGAFEAIGIKPTNIISPINVYEKNVLDDMGFPTDDDIPEEAIGEMAYLCDKAGWTETFALGFFPAVNVYDIKSAYPTEIRDLVNIRLGEWYATTQVNHDADLGYYRGTLTTWAKFHPFIYKLEYKGENRSYTPVGSWETCLTLKEIKFLEKWGLGTFELAPPGWDFDNEEPIPSGWEFRADRNVDPYDAFPFYEIVTGLIEAKEAAPNDAARGAYKRIPNGLGGKFVQGFEGELGKFFNSVYSAEMTTNTRLKVAELCLENEIIPIAVVIDSVMTTEDLVIDESGAPGSWRLANTGSAIVAGTGVVAIEGKQGHGDFSLTYSWLKGEIDQDPQANRYSMERLTPFNLKLWSGKSEDFPKLGSLRVMSRAVEINYDYKRAYRKTPKNGADLMSGVYASSPWGVDLIRIGGVAPDLDPVF